MRALHPLALYSLDELAEWAKLESNPRVRSRLLMIRFLHQGHTAPEAAEAFALAVTQVRFWIHRYNRGGAEALQDLPRPGRPTLLEAEKEDAFCTRVRAGAQVDDGVCSLRALEFQRILKDEFGAAYSISGVYFLLHRLGFSSLVPRSRHPQANTEEQETFKKTSRCS